MINIIMGIAIHTTPVYLPKWSCSNREGEATGSQHNPLVKGGSIPDELPFGIIRVNDRRFAWCNLYLGFCLINNETQIIVIWFLLHLPLLNVVVHTLPRWVWPPFLSGAVNIEPPYRNIWRVVLGYPELLLLFAQAHKILFSGWCHIRHRLLQLGWTVQFKKMQVHPRSRLKQYNITQPMFLGYKL